jgi:RHS repeat-associated protein
VRVLLSGLLLAAILPVQAWAVAPELSETPEITFSDSASADLASKAAELKTPLAMYEYVRNNFEFALYQGSRGASLNTFLGQRGNDVDTASALIAMLRSQGYPARYAVGTVKRDTAAVENWLGVSNPDVAQYILLAQGIQQVQFDSDKSHIQFEQVWVEVLTRVDNYRGAGPDAQTPCVVGDAHCMWVPLAPAFKLHAATTPIINPLDVSPGLDFDYTDYYNAIKNNDADRMNKNPLDIYEKQILDYLHATYPSKALTLADVEDVGAIKQEKLGLLPLSLPFEIVSAVRRYNSVSDHDTQVGSGKPETKPWAKYLYLDTYKQGYDANGNPGNDPAYHLLNNKRFLLTDLATHRLTLTFGICPSDNTMVQAQLRLDGIVDPNYVSVCEPSSVFQTGTQVITTLKLDGAPDYTGGTNDDVITVVYSNEVVGGYYLIGTGGDTSNWSQVHRAAAQLLQANQDYHILNDSNGVPYVDANKNGVIDSGEVTLLNSPDAMDKLTGGLLYSAMSLYFAEARDHIVELGSLNHVVAPISGWVGIVSSVYSVQYLDGTSYSIMPGGLLIDMKGVNFSTVLRDNQAPIFADRHFALLGHVMSSLEHEVWQQLTGYDAVSTVRGIQMALANGASLADINPSLSTNASTAMGSAAYALLGYNAAPPSPFVAHTNQAIFNSSYNPYSSANWWSLSPDDGQVHSFVMLKKSVSASTISAYTLAWSYSSSQQIIAVTDLNNNFGYFNSVDAFDSYYTSNWQRLSALSPSTQSTITFPPPNNFTLSASAGSLLTTLHDHYFKPTYNLTNNVFLAVLDGNTGFVASQWVYKTGPLAVDDYSPYFVTQLRQIYYMPLPSDTQIHEIVLPSKQVSGATYRFSVYIDKQYDPTALFLDGMSFMITNNSFVAGGGYVDGSTFVDTAKDTTGQAFNNAVFNDKGIIGLVNNNQVMTPSTADPVSTVTGNMYHDETDLAIPGRGGLGITFTRTYNSNLQGKTGDGKPLSLGWTHSYNIQLRSNDYGQYPDYPVSQAPENANGTTSSITYSDERGGDANFLVDDLSGSYAITHPKAVFATLSLDTPQAGQDTLTFPNGVKYVFQGGNLKQPGNTAQLIQESDAFGNQLNFGYTNGQLTSITDNFGVSGHTGLTLAYNSDGRLQTVTDWAGRSWQYAYDSGGNLASVTDPLSQVTTYQYKPGTHLVSGVIKPETRGNTHPQTQFSYYQNDRAFNYADALGEANTLDYDLFRKSTRITDPLGAVTEQYYDANGALTSLREPDGGLLYFQNSGDGLRWSKTDALGFNTSYSYRTDHTLTGGASDKDGLVTYEKDPRGNAVTTDYGIYDQVTRKVDKNGNQFLYTYFSASDANSGAVAGKLAMVQMIPAPSSQNNPYLTDPHAGQTLTLQSFTYYPSGQLAKRIEYIDPANPSRQRVTLVNYYPGDVDISDVWISGATSGGTIHKHFTYDSLDRVTSQTLYRQASATDTTLLSLTTSWTYDALSRVVMETDPLGDCVKTNYDKDGLESSREIHYLSPDCSAGTQRTLYTNAYDAADRLVSRTDTLGGVTKFAYDAAGNRISQTDPDGNVTRFEYDAKGRRTAAIDANGNRTETEYDLDGRAVAVTDANGNMVQFTYDALGEKTHLTTALGFDTQMQYDPNGNVTGFADPMHVQGQGAGGNNTYVTYYDGMNRPVRIVNVNADSIYKTYDLLGELTSVTDEAGNTTTMVYDDLGRVIQVKDPLVETPVDKVTSYTYDQASNVLTKTDRNGNVTRYTYDNLNRLRLTEFLADGTSETHDYNDAGDLYSEANQAVTNTYTYDELHRLRSKTDSRSNRTMGWDYDAAGNVVRKTDFQNDVTTYQYDSTNRLVAMANKAYVQASYQYDGAGRLLSRILSNGARTVYSYDDDNRLLTLTNIAANGAVLETMTYTRDKVGNATAITTQKPTGTETVNYTYDALYRLTQADYPHNGTSSDIVYRYDNGGGPTNSGNRTALILNGTLNSKYFYVYDADNRLTEVHLGLAQTDPLLYRYLYDANGNRTDKLDANGNTLQHIVWDQKNRIKSVTQGGQTTLMAYDPDDYRISKQAATQDSFYLEGKHLEAIYGGNGALKQKYLRGAVVDELLYGYSYDSNGKATPATYQHDQVTSVTEETDPNGNVLASFKYDPFGNVLGQTGTPQSDLRYTGRNFDSDSGLYYYRARYYDPEIGRFISEDPKGFDAGINFYAYANNNPLSLNDPTGFDPHPPGDYPQPQNPLLVFGSVLLDQLESGQVRDEIVGAGSSELQLAGGGAEVFIGTKIPGPLGVAMTTYGLSNIGGGASSYINTVAGTNYDWNFVQQGYSAASSAAGLDPTYGNYLFTATDLFMNLSNMTKIVPYSAFTSGSGLPTLETFGTTTQIGKDFTLAWQSGNSLNLIPVGFDLFSAGSDILSLSTGNVGSTSNTSAAGGYVIYPDSLNLNSSSGVYAK